MMINVNHYIKIIGLKLNALLKENSGSYIIIQFLKFEIYTDFDL
jgi:hypothetical protein